MPALTLRSALLTALARNVTRSPSLNPPSLLSRDLTTSGPHPTITTSLPHLNHTVYAPADLGGFTDPVPAIVWGNDACNASTGKDPYEELNSEIASWGYVVLACGEPGAAVGVLGDGGGVEVGDGGEGGEGEEGVGEDSSTTIHPTAFGMLGTAGAGASLYRAAEDPRVLSLAILDTDSTAVSTPASRARAANATKPVFYFSASSGSTSSGSATAVGGEMAGLRADVDAVAQGVPKWLGVLPGSDGEGKLGRAVRFWAAWMLGGVEGSEGSGFFTEAEGAESEGWTVERRGLEVLVL